MIFQPPMSEEVFTIHVCFSLLHSAYIFYMFDDGTPQIEAQARSGTPGLRGEVPIPQTIHVLCIPRDPSTFSEGDWRHSYVGFEGPVVPSEKVLGSLGFSAG